MTFKTLLTVGSLMIGPSLPLHSSEIVTKPNAGAIAQVQWLKLSGWVEEKDADHRRLQIRDKNGNVARITVDENVQIFRDWRLIALNDVRVKDRLTLKRADTSAQ